MALANQNSRKTIYNLEFPPWCPQLTIYGYQFRRAADYENQVKCLQHLVSKISEFSIEATNGGHAPTSVVEIPETEEKAVLEWAGEHTALQDLLLLLSIFTGREVFIIEDDSQGIITADPRQYQWGGILRVSIPYKEHHKNSSESNFRIEIASDNEWIPTDIDPYPYSYDIGFEEGLNRIYKLIRAEHWQKKYGKGYFLFLAKSAFRRQTLESAFIQCWTIGEHIFTLHHRSHLTDEEIRRLSSKRKIEFLLREYALKNNINKKGHQRLEELANARNRLVHYGRFPESGIGHQEAILFIRLIEFVIAKILELSPSNLFNTVERLEEFLSDQPLK